MALSAKAREILEVALANKKAAKEVADSIDASGNAQAAAVAAIATADGSDAATTQALANATKAKVNQILAALKAAGLMAN